MKYLIIFEFLLTLLYADLSEESIRYFGGYSQSEVLLIKSTIHTAPIVITEQVFNAKKPADIDKVVQEQQLKDISNMLSAKEFLEDNTGHLFGGYSENKLSFKQAK